MAKRSKLPEHIRQLITKQNRDIARRSSKNALKDIESARADLKAAERRAAAREYRQTNSAVLNALIGMSSAVARSWGISAPILLKPGYHGDRFSASTDFKSVRILYPVDKLKFSNGKGNGDRFDAAQLKMLGSDIRALVYHEVGHIRFTTPIADLLKMVGREFEVFGDATAQFVLHRSWNMLEDQRMEAAVVAESPVIARYFTTFVLRWILDERKYHGRADCPEAQWLLVSGRNYLPASVRRDMRTRFVAKYGEDITRRAEQCIAKYKSAKDAQTMVDMVFEMYYITKALGLVSVPTGADDHGGTRPNPNINTDKENERIESSATNDGETDQQSQETEGSESTLKATIDRDIDNEYTEESDGVTWEPPSHNDDFGNWCPPTESGGSSDSDNDSTDNDSGTSGNDAPDGDTQTNSGPNAGKSGNPTPGQQPKPLKEAIEDALEDIAPAIEQDEILHDLVRSVNENLLSGDSAIPKDAVWATQLDDFADKADAIAYDISNSLRTFTADSEPLWQSRTSRGYIDPFAYRTRSSGSNEYRRSLDDIGNTGTDISVTVMLDTSSSMEGSEYALGAAAYACKRACEIVGISCTVMTFSSDGHLLWGNDDEAKHLSLICDGGTEPEHNFKELDHFRFDAKTHLVVVMTDGQFSMKGCDAYRTEGRYFVGLAYGSYSRPADLIAQQFDAAKRVTDLTEIPEIIGDFVASFLR